MLCKKCFSSCQTNSIGLRSGGFGQHFPTVDAVVFHEGFLASASVLPIIVLLEPVTIRKGFLDEGQQSIGNDLGYVVGISIQIAML